MYQVRDVLTDDIKAAATQLRALGDVMSRELLVYACRSDGSKLTESEAANLAYWTRDSIWN